jgi:hypothetical protein
MLDNLSTFVHLKPHSSMNEYGGRNIFVMAHPTQKRKISHPINVSKMAVTYMVFFVCAVCTCVPQ